MALGKNSLFDPIFAYVRETGKHKHHTILFEGKFWGHFFSQNFNDIDRKNTFSRGRRV